MALNFPTLKQIVDRSRSDLRELLPKLQPSLVSSFIRAIVDSNSARAFDMVVLIRQMLDQAFPQTAVGEYLDRWGGYNNLQQNAAQSAGGNMVIQGTSGTAMPSGTVWNSVSGQPYTSQQDVNIAPISQGIASAVALDTIITCTTSNPHSLASGILATVTGLTDSSDTASAFVTVIDEVTFSFVAPTNTDDGDVWTSLASYSFNGAVVPMLATDSGKTTNLASGDLLAIVTPIAGVSPNGFADANGFTGGVEAESTEEFRERIIDRRANPVANFNQAAIELQARKIRSVSRIFILPITPYPGAVTIYFFVNDTPDGLPSATQIEAVKASIVEIMPVTTDVQDIIVAAPNIIPVDVVISSLIPNTVAMREAIEANLKAYFEDQVDMGQPITLNSINLVIQNTQDTTGTFPTSFELDSPSSTVIPATDEIAVFGSVVIS